MHFFVSAGEPSGDLHGANLVQALKARSPDLKVTGFGGERMAAEGVDLLYPLTNLAVMWFGKAMAHLPTFFKIARQAEVHFRRTKPDAVILIDYPGFHWEIAKRAHRAGIPVYYFVPPQLWAWAGWRVKKVRKWVNTVLTALPFEEEWYRERGVKTHYIGHPYFDELGEQQVDREFVASLKAPQTPIVAFLPGSRTQEVEKNFPQMISTMSKVKSVIPHVRFLVPAFKEHQAKMAREMLQSAGVRAEVFVGRTTDVIEAADVCVAVSGSVSLELMYRLKPTVILYKIAYYVKFVMGTLLKCKYITLVNLLANAEIYPEYLTTGDKSDEIAKNVTHWLQNPESRNEVISQLQALKTQAAIPGACERAADFLLSEMAARSRQPAQPAASNSLG